MLGRACALQMIYVIKVFTAKTLSEFEMSWSMTTSVHLSEVNNVNDIKERGGGNMRLIPKCKRESSRRCIE